MYSALKLYGCFGTRSRLHNCYSIWSVLAKCDGPCGTSAVLLFRLLRGCADFPLWWGYGRPPLFIRWVCGWCYDCCWVRSFLVSSAWWWVSFLFIDGCVLYLWKVWWVLVWVRPSWWSAGCVRSVLLVTLYCTVRQWQHISYLNRQSTVAVLLLTFNGTSVDILQKTLWCC